ncbi:MAG: amidase [Pseudomonadales bacterium]
MTELAFKSAVELAALIKNKSISSLELTNLYIQRIERFDETINAVVVRDFERARAAAEAADQALANGQDLGPLHGLPMTIKEAYDLAGLPTTWGIPEFAGNIAATDSDTVARLKQAGAHFMGKTNVPLNLADFQSFNEVYGTTGNPWDPTRTPGGSSGGSSAALAAGLTALEAGSDIGGSIRNPSHFCGTYGHKPTWGVVSDQGHSLPGVAAAADIAVVGPMGRSAEDLRLSMDVVAGPRALDAPGWRLNLPEPEQSSLGQFRVALWPSHELAPVSTEISARVEQIGSLLSKHGATVSNQARPGIDFEQAFETYNSLLWGVMASGMTPEERRTAQETAAQLPDTDRSMPALVARYSVQDHATWAGANNARFHLRAAWRAFFDDWDILICPQMATTAFPHDHGDYMQRTLSVNNESQDYFQQVFWSGMVTVAHLPSTVFPTGPSSEGLPIGLQAVGPEYQDYRTIEFARLLAEEIGGFQAPPGFE